MSQVFQQITWRKTRKEILYLYEKLSKTLEDFIVEWTNKIPELYKDKKDFWDIDFFWKLKENIDIDKKELINILKKNNLIIWEEVRNYIANKGIIEKKTLDELKVIVKNDIEWTMLAYDIDMDKFFHIDLHLVNEKKDRIDYDSYFEYYKKPFFSYHLGIILRKFWIKYSSKGVFYRCPQQIFWKDENLLISDNLNDFIKWLDIYFSDHNFLENYENIKENKDIISTLSHLLLLDYRFFLIDNLKYEEKRKINTYKINENLNKLILSTKIINVNLLDNIDNKIKVEEEMLFDRLREKIAWKEDFFINYYNEKYIKNWIWYDIPIWKLNLYIFYKLLNSFQLFSINFANFIIAFERKQKEQKFKKILYIYLFWEEYWKTLAELYKNKDNKENVKYLEKIAEIIKNFEDYFFYIDGDYKLNNEKIVLELSE